VSPISVLSTPSVPLVALRKSINSLIFSSNDDSPDFRHSPIARLAQCFFFTSGRAMFTELQLTSSPSTQYLSYGF
jgi:hypothetical protein